MRRLSCLVTHSVCGRAHIDHHFLAAKLNVIVHCSRKHVRAEGGVPDRKGLVVLINSFGVPPGKMESECDVGVYLGVGWVDR